MLDAVLTQNDDLDKVSPSWSLIRSILYVVLLLSPLHSGGSDWDEVKLRYFAAQALSPSAALFQEAFLEDVIALTDQKEFVAAFYETSSQLRSGLDQEVRPIYVSAQGDFERTLAFYLNEGKVTHLVGVIHTPTPAPPLCTEGEISRGLVDVQMEDDPRRLYTVMKRPEIVREYMRCGGILIAAYPEGGLGKRTREQQAIFQQAKEAFPDHLIDLPLACCAMEKDMVGATYLFRTQDGDWMAFGIMASQANAPEDGKLWGMWFGPLSDPLIYQRVHSLFSYLHMVQDQDLSPYLFGIY